MKNYFLIAVTTAVLLVSCKKTETNIETVENADGTITTTTTEKEHSTTLDSAKIDATVDRAKENLNEAGNKIDSAAKEVGHDLKKAGEDVKDAAAKGAEKVEQGAQKLKEDLKKK